MTYLLYTFTLKWVIGMIVFFVPPVPVRIRAFIMPFHTSIGLFLYTAVLATCALGITEMNISNSGNK